LNRSLSRIIIKTTETAKTIIPKNVLLNMNTQGASFLAVEEDMVNLTNIIVVFLFLFFGVGLDVVM